MTTGRVIRVSFLDRKFPKDSDRRGKTETNSSGGLDSLRSSCLSCPAWIFIIRASSFFRHWVFRHSSFPQPIFLQLVVHRLVIDLKDAGRFGFVAAGAVEDVFHDVTLDFFDDGFDDRL